MAQVDGIRRVFLGGARLTDFLEDNPAVLTRPTVIRGRSATYSTQASSLGIFGPANPVRVLAFDIVNTRWFENLTLLVIIANSITLGMDTPPIKDNRSVERFLLVSEIAFQTAFTVEALVKVVAVGLVRHEHSYLRSSWNCVDAAIVVAGFVSLSAGGGNVSVWRLLRVARPLRTVSRVAGMRTLMTTILTSLPNLLEVGFLLGFLLLIFAITGVNLFAGKLHYRCHVRDGASYHIIMNDTAHCSLSAGGRRCPDLAGHTVVCRRVASLGADDQILNFDNILNALLLCYKVISLDDWPGDMNKAQNSTSFFAFAYFFAITIIGAYFCINLVLALLSMHFDRNKAAEDISSAVQLSGLRLQLRGRVLSIADAQALNPGGVSPEGQEPCCLLDGDPTTKWADFNLARPPAVELVFREPIAFDTYALVTAPDNPLCDPAQWILDGQCGDGDWSVLHCQAEDFELPEGRSESTEWFSLDSSTAECTRLRLTVTRRRSDTVEDVQSEPESDEPSVALPHVKTPPPVSADDDGRGLDAFRFVTTSPPTPQEEEERLQTTPPRASVNSLHGNLLPTGSLAKRLSSPFVDTSALVATRRRAHSVARRRTQMQKLEGLARAQELTRHFVTHRWFGYFMLSVTLVNILCMAMDHHQIDSTFSRVLCIVNFVCSVTFAVEMLIKWFGFFAPEPKGTVWVYVRDAYSMFDCLLVFISVPELVLSTVDGVGSCGGFGGAMSAFRALRLARVARLAQRLPELRALLQTIVVSLVNDVPYLLLIMLLVIYIFGILGLQMFSGVYGADGATPGREYVPEERNHFDTLPQALLTTFVVITGESWATIMQRGMLGTSWAAAIYFVVLFTFGNYVLLNLVIAILIVNFSNASQERAVQVEDSPPDRFALDVLLKARFNERLNVVEPALMSESSSGAGAPVRPASSSPDPSTPRASDSGPAPTAPGAVPNSSANASALAVATVPPPNSSDATSVGSGPLKASSAAGLRRAPAGLPSGAALKSAAHPVAVNPLTVPNGAADPGQLEREGTLTKMRLMDPGSAGVQQSVMDVLRTRLRRRRMQHAAGAPGLRGRTLGIFSAQNPIRVAASKVVTNPFFDWGVVFLITVNIGFLAADDPSADRRVPGYSPTKAALVEVGDYVFTVLFCLEAIAKIITHGLFSPDNTGYLNSVWNRIDLVVCVTAIPGLFVKEFKLFRSLRAVRLVILSSSVRILVLSLFTALPQIAYVCLVCSFLWLVFGILGVQLFKGTFYYCTDPAVALRDDCSGTYAASVMGWNGTYTRLEERQWVRTKFHFDNVGAAMLALFEVAAGEGWAEIMYTGIDSSLSEKRGLQRNQSPEVVGFFLVFVIMGGFFAMNLFVGMLIEQFEVQKAELIGLTENGVPTLSESQRDWLQARKIMSRTTLQARPRMPDNTAHRALIEFVLHPYFDHCIMAMIMINVMFMCVHRDDESQAEADMLRVVNIVFVALFTAEAVIKNLALTPRLYLRDPWNRFDLLLVLSSWASLLSSSLPTASLRVLRIGRLFRLVKRAKSLQKLFATLMHALPSLGNISVFLLIIFFIFGVVGVNLFGRLKVGCPECLGDNGNFRNLGSAITLLYTIATTETWPDTMNGCRIGEETGCNPNVDECELNCCGSDVAVPYYVLFMLFGSFVALNLFITVLIDTFQNENELYSSELQEKMRCFQQFRDVWVHFDPEAAELLPASIFVMIVRNLPTELLSRAGMEASAVGRSRLLNCLELPVVPVTVSDDGEDRTRMHVSYRDAQRALALLLFKVDSGDAHKVSVVVDKEKTPQQPDDVFLIRHYFAAKRLAQVVHIALRRKGATRSRGSLMLGAGVTEWHKVVVGATHQGPLVLADADSAGEAEGAEAQAEDSEARAGPAEPSLGPAVAPPMSGRAASAQLSPLLSELASSYCSEDGAPRSKRPPRVPVVAVSPSTSGSL